MPSRLSDNPHLDPQYATTLAKLPPAERERLLRGNWDVPDDGELFRREWIPVIEPHQVAGGTTGLRYWDLAASEPSAAYPDPDWTVGLKLEHHHKTGIFYVTDIVRERRAAGAVEQLVRATAERDGVQVAIRIEQEGGSAGKALVDRYINVLRGFNVRRDIVTGSKLVRAQPLAAAAENGVIRVVSGRHLDAFLDELTSFPHGRHDDCVDALARAHHHLSRLPSPGRKTSVPRGRIPNVGTAPGSYRSIPTRNDPIEQLAAQIGATIYDTRDDPRGPRRCRR